MTSVVCIASLYCMCLHVVLSLQASSPFRDIVKNRRARGDAKAGALGEKGELATITHKIFNSTREPRDSAKRKNCHRKRAAAYCVHHKWFLSSATRSHVLARLASLAQMGELSRRIRCTSHFLSGKLNGLRCTVHFVNGIRYNL